MAKATSKDQGITARPRLARARLGRDGAPLTAMSDAPDAEARQPEDDDDRVAADDDESLRLDRAAPPALAGSTHAPARLGVRAVSLPEWLLAIPGMSFIQGSINELLKVSWPTRAEAWNMTLVVIAISVAIAVLLTVADLGLAQALTSIINLGTTGHP